MSEYLLALVKVVSSYDKFVEVVDIYNGIYALSLIHILLPAPSVR